MNAGSRGTDHRKKCRRFNLPHHAHHFTFSCYQRRPFLTADRCRRWLIASLERARELLRFHLWAYVIMPEHVHLLLYPLDTNYSISRILRAIKQPVAMRAAKDRNHSGRESDGPFHFWQRGGGYDQNIVEAGTVWAVIDYIHLNPVRRGLCRFRGEWNWSSAGDYLGLSEGPLRIDRGSLPEDPRSSS